MLLAVRCLLCDAPGEPLCPRCAAALAPAPPGPVPAVLAYEGEARRLVAALKHRHAHRVVPVLARAMAVRLPQGVEAVTWAPTSPERRRRRGADQAQVVAAGVARVLGVPCRRMLARPPGDPPQMGRSRRQRLGSPPRFVAVGPAVGVVALVDDVATTGATLHAAAACLRAAGCRQVHPVVVAAAVPARRDLRLR